MLAAVELEKYIANNHIFSIIKYEFYHGQELCLVILVLINKNLEINFDYNILPFGLSICLRIKDDKKLPLDTKNVT